MRTIQDSRNETHGTAVTRKLAGAAVLASALLLPAWNGLTQEVVIQSLAQNGVLTWSNSVVGGAARVEWTPALGEPWQSSWELLTDIPVTTSLTARAVPMFYRVVSYPLPVPVVTNVSAAVGLSVLTNRFEDADFIVLDVRTPSEYASGHVKTALNVNFYSTAFQQTLLKLERKHTYMVYCASGNRSGQASETMRQLNFMKVYNLTQGYSSLAALPGANTYME